MTGWGSLSPMLCGDARPKTLRHISVDPRLIPNRVQFSLTLGGVHYLGTLLGNPREIYPTTHLMGRNCCVPQFKPGRTRLYVDHQTGLLASI